jgi:hypothetical protein
MRRSCTWTLTGSLSVLLVAPLLADEAPVQVGDKVRVTIAPAGAADPNRKPGRTVGRLVGIDADRVTLDEAPGRMVVARDSVLRLERQARKSRKAKGALVGFAIGAAAGVVTYYTFAGQCEDSVATGCYYLTYALVSGAAFGIPGAGIGALVAPGDRWEAARPLGAVAARPRSVGLRLSLRF